MKYLFLCLFAILSLTSIAQNIPDSRVKDIVFTNVNIIPMDKDIVLKNQTVVVNNGLIKTIGKAGQVTYDKNALIINAKGKFLMPGLAEMHAHVPPNEDMQAMKDVLMLFAANGVTTIRGMLGHPKHLELRGMIYRGEVIGPRFWTSGPSFSGVSVKSPEDGADMVRKQKELGYDFLKLHPGLSRAAFDAIAKTAKEVNIPFAGHVSFQVGVGRAIEAGYASIDHLDGFVESLIPRLDTMSEKDLGLFAIFVGQYADKSRISKLTKALKDNNIWVVPTQSLAERWMTPHKTAAQLRGEPEMRYMKLSDLDSWEKMKNNISNDPRYKPDLVANYIKLRQQLIYECHKQGVGLLLGSDAPQVFDVPGFSLHHELQYIVDAGLTPYEALKTGTVNAGKYFNRSDLGIIKADAVADLILLNDNPLKNIKNIRKIEGVMVDGRWLSRTYIDNELKKLVK